MGFQADSLTTGEPLKNNLYQSDYNQLGIAFAPLVCNSFGQQGPDLLRYQWTAADTTAQHIVSVPTLSPPAWAPSASALVPSSATPQGVAQLGTPHQQLCCTIVPQYNCKLRPSNTSDRFFFRQSTQEILVGILEGVCEHFFGRTYAMQ